MLDFNNGSRFFQKTFKRKFEFRVLAEACAGSISFDKFELELNKAEERRANESRGEQIIVENSRKEESCRGENGERSRAEQGK